MASRAVYATDTAQIAGVAVPLLASLVDCASSPRPNDLCTNHSIVLFRLDPNVVAFSISSCMPYAISLSLTVHAPLAW